jgi:hypothetical protein
MRLFDAFITALLRSVVPGFCPVDFRRVALRQRPMSGGTDAGSSEAAGYLAPGIVVGAPDPCPAMVSRTIVYRDGHSETKVLVFPAWDREEDASPRGLLRAVEACLSLVRSILSHARG